MQNPKLQTPRRKQEKNLSDNGLDKNFLDMTLTAQSIKEMNKSDFVTIKNICSAKTTKKMKKTSHRLGKYYCKMHLTKGLLCS